MIIKFYDLKNNLDKKIDFFLLYGNNKGLIEETIKNTFKPIFTKNIISYDEAEIINNVEAFQEEILNKSLFESEKFLIINRSSDKIVKIIENIVEKKIKDLKIIITAGILEKRSKLRNFFEKNSNTITVPFYEDNYQTLLSLAERFFKDKKISISQQNINLIVERSKNDRISLKNELEKINNYSVDKNNIDTNKILKITNLAENYHVSELVDNCLSRNKKKIITILNENNPAPEDNILILRTFLFKLKRLKQLKLNLNLKNNVETVMSSFKPPIFWKEKDLIKLQLRLWSLEQIQKLIFNINKLELLIKKNPQISNYIINNFILEKLENPNSEI